MKQRVPIFDVNLSALNEGHGTLFASLSHVQRASCPPAKTAKASEGEGGDDIHAGHVAHRDELGLAMIRPSSEYSNNPDIRI